MDDFDTTSEVLTALELEAGRWDVEVEELVEREPSGALRAVLRSCRA